MKTQTHLHRCRNGKIHITITRPDLRNAIVETGFLFGGPSDEAWDVLDSLLVALEQVAESRGSGSAGGEVTLPSGRTIFLMGDTRTRRGFSCCGRDKNQPLKP